MTQDVLKSILVYNEYTGIFVWLPSTDKRKAIGIAGKDDGGGYLRIPYKGKRYKLHRLVFLYMYGSFPLEDVDHINGNKADNSLSNLREVSRHTNSKNRKLPNTNTSGHIGVYLHKPTRKWQARIMVDGKSKSLGLFINKNEAIKKRIEAQELTNFHKNHGRK